MGRVAAFNVQHRYTEKDSRKLDKRMFADGYKCTLLTFKYRYEMPLYMNINMLELNPEISQTYE